jgi:uncharacterized membrane protein YqjE
MTGPSGSGSSALTPEPSHGASGHDVAERGVGELVKEVTQDLTKLFNQEVELAKAEVKVEAKKAGKTGAAFGGAGLAGYFVLLFASLTLLFALASLFDSYTWAALAVTVLWAIVAAVLFSRARKQAKQLNPKPEMTVQTLKEDAQWAKTRSS